MTMYLNHTVHASTFNAHFFPHFMHTSSTSATSPHFYLFSTYSLLPIPNCLSSHLCFLICFFRSCAASLLLSFFLSHELVYFFILMSCFASSFLVPWILLSSWPLLCFLYWTLFGFSRDIFWHLYVMSPSLNPSQFLVTFFRLFHQFVPPNCIPRFLVLVSFVFLAVSPFLFINTSRQTIFAWTVCVSVWACTSFLFPSSFRVLLLCKWDHQAFLHRFFFPMFLFLFVTVFSECTVFSPCDVWLLQCMHWTLPSQIIQ